MFLHINITVNKLVINIYNKIYFRSLKFKTEREDNKAKLFKANDRDPKVKTAKYEVKVHTH